MPRRGSDAKRASPEAQLLGSLRKQYEELGYQVLAMPGVVALFLSGCGTLVGAGAGGLVGNQFGKGSGKDAATAAGVIGGGILGHEFLPF